MVKPANGKFNEGLGKKEPLSNELLSKKKNRLIWRKVAESVLLIWHAEEQRAQGKFSFILKIKQYFRNMIEPGPGILLIADPFLKDPNFLRTVVLLCDHKEEGSFGFVLNKQIEQTLDELLNNFDGFKLPVYYGGPVQTDTIHFVHQYPDLIPDAYEISKGMYWGGNFESVSALIKSDSLDLNKIKFFIGYSGWGDGQLSNELKEKSWLTVGATKNLVFNTEPEEVWKGSLKHLGGDYEMLVNYPIDPQLN